MPQSLISWAYMIVVVRLKVPTSRCVSHASSALFFNIHYACTLWRPKAFWVSFPGLTLSLAGHMYIYVFHYTSQTPCRLPTHTAKRSSTNDTTSLLL